MKKAAQWELECCFCNMLTKTIENLNQLIVDNLPKIRQIPFDVIVHLPRSGTIPASILATYMSKAFASVDEYCQNIVSTRKSEYKDLKSILLVDDSIRTGVQILAAIAKIKKECPDTIIHTLVVYSTKTDRLFQPTLVLSEHEDQDYMYPWFLWKSKRIQEFAVDLDGVLCRDCTKEEDDDGERYLNFLRTAEVKFHTKFTIGAIITSRLDKYKLETEEWLRNNKFQYRYLFMGQWASPKERKGKQAEYKAQHYKNWNLKLYIESSAKEAPEIARLSGKPVWCIDTSREYR